MINLLWIVPAVLAAGLFALIFWTYLATWNDWERRAGLRKPPRWRWSP